jgi:hypothetical protein
MVVLQQRGDATIKSAKAIRERHTLRKPAMSTRLYRVLYKRRVCELLSIKMGNHISSMPGYFRRKCGKVILEERSNYILDRDREGGILLSDDIDDKTGSSIKEVLLLKHPEVVIQNPSTLHPYDVPPSFKDASISHDIIEQVAKHIYGSAGLDSVYSQSMSH